jgi:hypothetical protein
VIVRVHWALFEYLPLRGGARCMEYLRGRRVAMRDACWAVRESVKGRSGCWVGYFIGRRVVSLAKLCAAIYNIL